MKLIQQWRERLRRFEDHPEVAKGMDATIAMGTQHGRLTALKECLQEIEALAASDPALGSALGIPRNTHYS